MKKIILLVIAILFTLVISGSAALITNTVIQVPNTTPDITNTVLQLPPKPTPDITDTIIQVPPEPTPDITNAVYVLPKPDFVILPTTFIIPSGYPWVIPLQVYYLG